MKKKKNVGVLLAVSNLQSKTNKTFNILNEIYFTIKFPLILFFIFPWKALFV